MDYPIGYHRRGLRYLNKYPSLDFRKSHVVPDDVTIAAGATVTWTNSDSVAHTSTSDASGWNSGTIAPGGRFSFTFQTPGTFSYHCAIHPGMIGTVVVR